MAGLTKIDFKALIQIMGARGSLTAQQYRELRGQVLSGKGDEALTELQKILLLNGSNAIKGGKR